MLQEKIRYLAIATVCITLGGCSDTSSPSAPPKDTTPISPSQPAAAFADSNLEAAVRTALDGLTGTLTTDALLSLERLSARDRGIADLHGIEQLQHLQALDLSDNRIVDLLPLVGLTRLQFLDLTNNQVEELSPLAGLDSLESLALAYNPIEELTPLLGLDQLEWLEVLGLPLSQKAQESQLPVLQARGVKVSLTPAGEQPEARPDLHTRISFISDRDEKYGRELYVVDPGGEDVRQIVLPDSLVIIAAKWSPDGAKIALQVESHIDTLGVFNGLLSLSSRYDIYLIDRDGSHVVSLTAGIQEPSSLASCNYKRRPSWSPDGTQIAFEASGGEAYGFWVVDTDGTDLHPHLLVEDRETELLMKDESLSPQWDKIAFFSGVGATPGTLALYVSDINGRNWSLLVDAVVDSKKSGGSFTENIAWSPDSQRIAFVSNRDGNREIYMVNVDGSNVTRITQDSGYDGVGAWSPDGRWLAFNTNRETRWDVFAVEVESKATYNVTRTFADEYAFDWLDGE